MQLEGMIMNVLIVSAEVLLLVLIFSLMNLIIGRFFGRIMKLSVLQKREDRADILRKNIKGGLILLCIALCILVAGLNGFLVYQGKHGDFPRAPWCVSVGLAVICRSPGRYCFACRSARNERAQSS